MKPAVWTFAILMAGALVGEILASLHTPSFHHTGWGGWFATILLSVLASALVWTFSERNKIARRIPFLFIGIGLSLACLALAGMIVASSNTGALIGVAVVGGIFVFSGDVLDRRN